MRLRSSSHSKCQATKLPLKIQSLPSSKGRLKGGKEKSQIQRTVQIKWSLLLTKHILQKHTRSFSGGAALDKMWVSFEKDIISNEFWKCHTEYWSIKSCRQRDRGQQRALPVIQFSELADTSSPRQMASANGRGREVAGARQGLCCHSELWCSEHCWSKCCVLLATSPGMWAGCCAPGCVPTPCWAASKSESGLYRQEVPDKITSLWLWQCLDRPRFCLQARRHGADGQGWASGTLHSAEPDQGFGAKPGAAAYRAQALKAWSWQEELGRGATDAHAMSLFALGGDAQATCSQRHDLVFSCQAATSRKQLKCFIGYCYH